MKAILSIFIFFLSTLVLNANERDTRLDALFIELKKNIPSSSPRIARQIWTLWSTHPTDQFLTQRLAEGSRLVINNKLDEDDHETITGIDGAIDVLSDKQTTQTFNEFYECQLKILKEEQPGLRLSQYNDRIHIMWKKSVLNPKNVVN